MNDIKETRVLFVCMGNICRSPAAEGILKQMVSQKSDLRIEVQSCGIGDWHLGRAPDERIPAASKARGIVLTSKAQQFQKHFLDHFDYILAADKEVLKYLYYYAKTPEHKAKVAFITEYSPNYKGEEIPDPYYKAEGAFELVLDMLEDSCEGLLQHIQQKSQFAH